MHATLLPGNSMPPALAGMRPDSPPLTRAAIWREPLPDLGLLDRLLARTTAAVARRKVRAVHGAEHVAPAADPFILALNHSTRIEALVVPAILVFLRRGRRIHFMADWNFRMIPPVDLLYRRSGAITVMRKSARPRFLNALKPLYAPAVPAMEQARACLLAGNPVGIFPEGTANRDPARLLRGRLGAARLSLETHVPVVPVGLRFPAIAPGHHVPEGSVMEIHIGAALHPVPPHEGPVSPARVRAWHARIMTEISRLSGKAWEPPAQEA